MTLTPRKGSLTIQNTISSFWAVGDLNKGTQVVKSKQYKWLANGGLDETFLNMVITLDS